MTILAATTIVVLLWLYMPLFLTEELSATRPSARRGREWIPEARPQPQRRSRPPPRSLQPEELNYCARVKEETHAAAVTMTVAAKANDRRDDLLDSLKDLSGIYCEQLSAGHQGLLAMTEFCNVV